MPDFNTVHLEKGHIGFVNCGHLKGHYLLFNDGDFLESLCGRTVYISSTNLNLVDVSELNIKFDVSRVCKKCLKLFEHDYSILVR